MSSLGSGPEDPHHARIVAALLQLANALDMSPNDHDDAAKVREVAQDLESSPSSSSNHANLVKQGFAVGLHALLARPSPSGHDAEFRRAIEALRRNVDALNADLPLLQQEDTTARAFRAATNAVYLAAGEAPPFAQAEPSTEPTSAVGSAADELRQAQADVLKLGQSRWEDTRQASAQALSSVADVIEARDHGHRQSRRIAIMRFQERRLKNAAPITPGQAKWLKEGLATALDALDALQAVRRRQERSIVAPWMRAARDATDGIDTGQPLSFQRGAIQDGFRATVDALQAASQAGTLCR